MFSATWPREVRELANKYFRSPVRVTVGSDDLTANTRVKQIVEVRLGFAFAFGFGFGFGLELGLGLGLGVIRVRARV